MVHRTLIHYKDADGIERVQLTNSFNAQTSILDIVGFILSFLRGDFAFDLQIKDPDFGFIIDFDDHYLDEFKPYADQTVTSIVELTVLQTCGKLYLLHALLF
jgi:hypothetical protein